MAPFFRHSARGNPCHALLSEKNEYPPDPWVGTTSPARHIYGAVMGRQSEAAELLGNRRVSVQTPKYLDTCHLSSSYLNSVSYNVVFWPHGSTRG